MLIDHCRQTHDIMGGHIQADLAVILDQVLQADCRRNLHSSKTGGTNCLLLTPCENTTLPRKAGSPEGFARVPLVESRSVDVVRGTHRLLRVESDISLELSQLASCSIKGGKPFVEA